MLDIQTENAPDRRPAILVCVYDPEDAARLLPENGARASWMSGATRTVAIDQDAPGVLAEVITRKLRQAECHAVLLVGRTRRSDGFRVQMRAENRSLAGGSKWSGTSPALARATAPVSEMVQGLNAAGLSAAATSDSEDDAGSYLLYRVLTALPDDVDVPAVALLRAPQTVEISEFRRGVEIALEAIARRLSPLPR